MTDVTSPRGEVRRGEDGEQTLVFRRQYPDPIEDVWAALTESDRLARWFGPYEGIGRPGGSVQLSLTAEEEAGSDPVDAFPVHILECEEPSRLVVEIPEGDEPPWRITVTLDRENDWTVLRFEQVIPADKSPANAGVGWHWYLDRFEAALTGAAMPDWVDYYPSLTSAYA